MNEMFNLIVVDNEPSDMAKETITERTLYVPLSKLVDKIGFRNIQEVRSGKGYIDFVCFYDSRKFLVEIKIEDPHTKWKNLLEGVTQVLKYSKSIGTEDFVVIEYPSNIRRPLVCTPEVVEKLATESQISALVSTEFWTKPFTKITPDELLRNFKEKADIFIARQEKDISLDLAVETIRDAISTISRVLRQSVGTIDNLINTVVGRFDLFLALGEEKEETLKMAAIDLSSYLLVNQILFYHIYSSLTKKIDDIDEKRLHSVYDLQEYFNKIKDINYKAIYAIDVVSNLPDINLIVENVRDIITAIKGTRASSIRHDLIGRIYHESLPFETRKKLATFYTKPAAAEILAGLCIDKWDESVIDPACGSGTLLVSAYRRKEDLYKGETKKEQLSIGEIEKLHNLFTQEQLTGIDIMPFASHLTAVNISAQNPYITTNKLRIAFRDSLSLQKAVTSPEFKQKGVLIKSSPKIIQKLLVEPERMKQTYFSRKGEVAEYATGVVSPEGVGERFTLKPCDVVIMNPPFSDRHKMPDDYKEELSTFKKLIAKCGNQINFWGFFLALADELIKKGGKIAAVIPINIARGVETEGIRSYILQNYHIKYIVKSTKDLAFSEKASFRDILLVVEKKKARKDDFMGLIFIKEAIKDMNLDEAKRIAAAMKRIVPTKDFTYSDKNFEIYFITREEIMKQKDNLMPLIGGTYPKNMRILTNFIKAVNERGNDKLSPFKKDRLKEGITSPKGLGQLIYITRPIDASRLEKSFIVFEKERDEIISAKIKDDIIIKIPKKVTQPALRTLTGVKNFDIAEQHDFIIMNEYEDFKRVLALSKWDKKPFNWSIVQKKISKLGLSYLAVPDKLNLSSENTHLTAAFSCNPLILSNLFFAYGDMDMERCKCYTLSLNSVSTLSQFLSYKSETLGTYIRLSAEDWGLTSQINSDTLSEKDKQILLNLFDNLKEVDFPSIIKQLEQRFPPRVELDKTILKILGFSDKEIDDWLPKVYDALVSELKAMKEIR